MQQLAWCSEVCKYSGIISLKLHVNCADSENSVNSTECNNMKLVVALCAPLSAICMIHVKTTDTQKTQVVLV